VWPTGAGGDRLRAYRAHLGIGMVYQHFTLVPGMTVAENLLLARGDLPAHPWRSERAELDAFMAPCPSGWTWTRGEHLSAGEKQKLEILKQLYLRRPADPGRTHLGADPAGGRRGAGLMRMPSRASGTARC
jgi:ABC-type lipoprotein export system ATPase subunit